MGEVPYIDIKREREYQLEENSSFSAYSGRVCVWKRKADRESGGLVKSNNDHPIEYTIWTWKIHLTR
jgi:hypothetical protein